MASVGDVNNTTVTVEDVNDITASVGDVNDTTVTVEDANDTTASVGDVNDTTATVSKTESKELQAFRSLQEDMKTLLELSVTCLASKLFAKHVIQDAVYEIIFDDECSGSSTRSKFFMHRIYHKVKTSEPQKGKEIINKLADIIGKDGALCNIAETLRDCDDAYDLQDEIDTIATSIQGSLDSIAGQAYAKEVITQQEYELTMDPAAKHSTRCINKIMKQVGKVIETKTKHTQPVSYTHLTLPTKA